VRSRRLPLGTRMLVGFAVGIVAGLLAHRSFAGDPQLAWFLSHVSQPVGKVFLRLLFMLVVPLIFSALVLGITGLGDLKSLGRIGLKTLAYTVVVSSIAVLLGLLLVNLLKPGEGLSDDTRARLMAGAADRSAVLVRAQAPKSGLDLVTEIVPSNPLRAAVDGDLLAWMFFALLFGIGLSLTRTEAARRLEEAIEGLYDVTMRLIGVVIGLAPIGVAALLFSLTAELGLEIVLQLARYVGVVVLALAIHQFVVYSLAVKLFGGMSPRFFFAGIQEAMITAFSTASSNATLPTALKVAEENLKLPAHVSRFVLTLGSTANQNGTALFEGVTVLFLAQFYGVHLALAQQVVVLFICILGGIGTAGVPGGSLPLIVVVLQSVGVPGEGIAVILGVDGLLDMSRTVLNVTGDITAALWVTRVEGRLALPVE